MGIKGLSKFISKKAPSAVKEVEIGTYFGRVIAIDASVIIYQFLTSARDHSTGLLNSIGEDTSHLSGVLYRSLRMLENGIKPIFVFDGKPPKEKEEELKKRADNREKVKVELDKAMSNGDTKLVESLSKRIVKISDSHIDSCKKLLDLMGIPFINAINDAEAQCALLVKSGHAFAVATEDMDALAFGAKYLIRKFSHPKDKSNQMKQYDLEEICNKLNIDNDQFVDLCILMGCDFCDTIKGLGPFNAYKYIQKYKSIDSIITNIDSKKFIIPDHFDFKNARNLFINPSNSMESLKIAFQWNKPNLQGLHEFMTNENNFNPSRIDNCIERLKKITSMSTQLRLDSFFTTKRPKSPELSENKKLKKIPPPIKKK